MSSGSQLQNVWDRTRVLDILTCENSNLFSLQVSSEDLWKDSEEVQVTVKESCREERRTDVLTEQVTGKGRKGERLGEK